MPARSVTIAMRERAERDIAAATAALAEQFGIAAPASRGYEGKDVEFNRARDLEGIAAFLNALTGTLATRDDSVAAIGRELATANAALDDAQQAINQLISVNADWAAWGGIVRLLLDEALQNQELRDALVASGWLEAEYSEGRGWVLSVVGAGPNLAALLAENAPLTGDDAPSELVTTPVNTEGDLAPTPEQEPVAPVSEPVKPTQTTKSTKAKP